MTRPTMIFAAVALIPALCGPLVARADTIEVPLCAGGTLAIPLPDAPAPPASEACCAKGCHAQRKRPSPSSD